MKTTKPAASAPSEPSGPPAVIVGAGGKGLNAPAGLGGLGVRALVAAIVLTLLGLGGFVALGGLQPTGSTVASPSPSASAAAPSESLAPPIETVAAPSSPA